MFFRPEIKNRILMLAVFCFLLSGFFVSFENALANTALQQAQGGLDEAARCGYGDCSQGSVADTGVMTSIPEAVGRVIGVVLSFLGALFMLLMIYAGILWMTARGNEQQVTKAKDLMTSAVVGLVIVLAAYAITNFIGSSLTSAG